MTFRGLIRHWLQRITDRLWRPRPRLIYRAGFAHAPGTPINGGSFKPTYDPRAMGDLRPAWTGNLSGPPRPPIMEWLPPSADLPTGGVRFALERPEGADKIVAVGLTVHGLPLDLRRFRIRASFINAEGPHGADDTWATVVLAGTERVLDAADERVAVTLQAKCRDKRAPETGLDDIPGARNNTPGGATPGTPLPYEREAGAGPWLPDPVFSALFSNGPASAFTLTMDVDRLSGSGEMWFSANELLAGGTGAKPYKAGRTFENPFIRSTDPATNASNDIGRAGIALAIAGGNGPVFVTLVGFTIYDLE